ncbi:hypothetical protein, partial [Salmonella sp. s60368]|uniref:hypothetical protein n=1 Tax=Salmonella sp. s60368 TaxID=3159723 RepID=UPI00397FDB9B
PAYALGLIQQPQTSGITAPCSSQPALKELSLSLPALLPGFAPPFIFPFIIWLSISSTVFIFYIFFSFFIGGEIVKPPAPRVVHPSDFQCLHKQ